MFGLLGWLGWGFVDGVLFYLCWKMMLLLVICMYFVVLEFILDLIRINLDWYGYI